MRIGVDELRATKGSGYMYDRQYLDGLARRYGPMYRTARPFRHIVIDDFVPDPSVLDRVCAEFPRADSRAWRHHTHQHSRKRAMEDVTQMGADTLTVLLHANASPFVEFLEELTGIEGLISDPHLVGGGLHEIEHGGFLDVHADFNRHDQLSLDRRLNLILYLNRDWPDEYGGHLELWDDQLQGPVQRIAPVFNRCVVFSTTDTSFHGHPVPLTCPPARTRRSLALYYYTNGRPAEEIADAHLTVYPKPARRRAHVVNVVRRLTPPIVVDAARKARYRLRRP
jgi:Rps23 Pro-64 3,4-dihydroxylase Tpa1-like proline 4-hydroxylase